MKRGWEPAPLRDLLEVQNGFAFDAKKFNAEVGVPLIRIRDLKGGETTEAKYSGSYDPDYLVQAGDLLIGMDGEFGCHQWKGEPALLNQRVCRLRNFSNTLLPRFLYYGINKYLKEIEDATAFTTVKHLSSKSVLSIDFPHPPLPEQQRIVTKLDAAFGALREAEGHVERNRANARELFESYSNGIHQGNSPKWIDTRVGDEVEIFTGFPFKSDRYTEAENDIRLLRGDNIIPGEFRWEGVKRWPADDVKEYGAYWLDEGDVVIAMDRTWIKSGLKYAIVAKADIPSLLVQRVARLRCKPSLDKRYLGYLIASRDFATYVLSVQTGTGVPHISGGQIAEFEFRRPPIEEQRLIAEKLDALKAETKQLEATYQQKLRELEGLKKGLLGAAFRGEL